MLSAVTVSPFALWRLEHPLWLCGFRPFFAATMLAAPLGVGLWLLHLLLGLPLPATAGGPLEWHAHEMILGFGLAAVTGFVLTGVPEFTHSAAVPARTVRRLVGLWLLGRVAFWVTGWGGHTSLAISALAHLGLLLGLMAVLAPRLWRDPERRHLAFLWGLGALAVCVAEFYVDAFTGGNTLRWLHAAVGVLMALIVVALSRISMRIVNNALVEAGAVGVDYLARPPRRNLAIVALSLCTVAELLGWSARLHGWLALAAAAALLNLLNDWHVGRALFRRWPLMLYGVYALMAAGYAITGVTQLMGAAGGSAGLHLLTVGALGLSIYVVMCIAGATHSGRAPDERAWVPVGATLLVVAALVRAMVAWPGADVRLCLAVSGLLWSGAYAMLAWHMLALLVTPRSDGASGCAGIQNTQNAMNIEA